MNLNSVQRLDKTIFRQAACSVLLFLYKSALDKMPIGAGIAPGCDLWGIDPLYHHQVCLKVVDPSGWVGGPTVYVDTPESLIIKEAAAKLGCSWVASAPGMFNIS